METGVDSSWYLEQYPDVANSEMAAQLHYDTFGRNEGRLPRPLYSLRLEKKLWGGFSYAASLDLSKLFEDDLVDFEERLFSAWALARWHASNRQWALAEPYIDFLNNNSANLPVYLHSQGVDLLRIQALLELGRQEDSKNVLAAIDGKNYRNVDIVLTASNIVMGELDLTQLRRDEFKLALLNRIYSFNNLSLIHKIDASHPLSIDNITGSVNYSVTSHEKVSILISAYNAQSYISTALRSLLEQSWSNIEIIVIDDCSTDNTCAIVEQFARQDGRIRLVKHLVNLGAYAARNTGLRHASGEFIATHDSDDWSHPLRIQLSLQALFTKPSAIASIASWTRADSNLMFRKPRPDGQLVHMSVATLMIKTEVLTRLGGWDDVRVAGDSELYHRLITLHGEDVVIKVLPETPLVIARNIAGSLTNATPTHARTEFFGLRKNYLDLYSAWHKKLNTADASPLIRNGVERNFPAPILSRSIPLDSAAYFQVVLYGDFSTASRYILQYRKLITTLCNKSIAIGIFHWPDYKASDLLPIDPYFVDKVLSGQLDLLTPGDRISSSFLALLDSNIFAAKLDAIPKVNFDFCEVVNQPEDIQSLSDRILSENSAYNSSLVSASKLFNPEWYLNYNPDVRTANIDAEVHFLNHGLEEERNPSPEFNSDYYRHLFNFKIPNNIPPFLHYLKFTRKTGYTHSLPALTGSRTRLTARPTVLLTGHASNAQIFGAERNLLEILDAFLVLKFNVVVTLPSFQNADYIAAVRQRSNLLHIVPSPLWTQSPTTSDWTTDRFCELIEANNISVVHANTIMQREPLLAAYLKGIKSVVHVHEILEISDEICKAIALAPADIYSTMARLTPHAIANSRFTASHLSCFTSIDIISNTVNFETLDIDNIVNPERVVIGLISSNTPQKGLYDFIELAKLLKSTPNAQLMIIGPNNNFVKSILSALDKYTDNITFSEYTAEPIDAVRQANIIINLSTCKETFGRSILEAMAARRPVLAYAHGAFNELITDNHNGFLLPFKDLNAMALKLAWLCDNPHRIFTMGKLGRRSALKKFNSRNLVFQLKRAYQALI